MTPASATTVRSSSALNECDAIWSGANAEQSQQAVDEQIQQPDDRIDHLEQRVIDQRGGQRDARRVQRRDRLRRNVAEDQDDDRQDEGGHEHGSLAAEALRENRHERGRRDVHGVVAEQDEADQAIGPLEQPLGEASAAMAGAGLMPQPIAIEAHQRRLGGREERRQHEQDDDQDDQQAYRCWSLKGSGASDGLEPNFRLAEPETGCQGSRRNPRGLRAARPRDARCVRVLGFRVDSGFWPTKEPSECSIS